MNSDARPTVRQVYALAAVLCAKTGVEFPQDRGAASVLLDKLKGRPGGDGDARTAGEKVASARV